MAVALMDEENDELLNDNLTADSDLRLISDVDDVSEMLQLVQSSRYLVYRERAISATQFHADIFLQTTPNSRFRTRTRMDKDSFKLVVDEIKDNPVFYNRSPFAHAPVWLQLAVALDRFGHYGSGASLNRSQELWDIRKGTADDYTDRVFKALNELSSRSCVASASATSRRKRSSQHTEVAVAAADAAAASDLKVGEDPAALAPIAASVVVTPAAEDDPVVALHVLHVLIAVCMNKKGHA
ncbi:hypothetical protein PF002_g17373 [Phytophthora fragariae]|uniref:Uncharacterized protein n=1 Tax=Phytophthora fragariae TaxID=53985 RepID=A0A6A3YCD8_9STRA|nr:hypothetical protein PF002_g17373 [Phytophthora fragariae]